MNYNYCNQKSAESLLPPHAKKQDWFERRVKISSCVLVFIGALSLLDNFCQWKNARWEAEISLHESEETKYYLSKEEFALYDLIMLIGIVSMDMSLMIISFGK